ncbi:MAG TPA: hypothetical protein VFS88_03625 [Micavibrio sp.]|nr:hypothetical protein [Micavibrio sp.]
MSDADKIMGFIPKDQYVKYTYYLLLASSIGAAVLTLLGLIGIHIPLMQLFGLAGIAGLILALIGFFIFKEEFSALDQSHLLYICIIIAVFFLAGLILGQAFALVTYLMLLVSLLVFVAQLIMVWTGYNSWSHGRSITKSNVKSEVQQALKRG